MNQMNYNIITQPSKDHLAEIKEWLLDEDNNTGEGFFCDWRIIENSFHKNKLIVLTENNLSIGFLNFEISDRVVDIVIAEIKPEKRGLGNGKILIEKSIQWFKQKGVFVLELYCSPISSEIIWKKLGFKNFPNGIIKSSSIYLYQIIVNTAKLYSDNDNIEVIEMWGFEDYRDEVEANWKWEVIRKNKSNELLNPIIYPCAGEWSVSHRKGSKIQEKNIMKYFDKKRHDGGYFLIISKLKK